MKASSRMLAFAAIALIGIGIFAAFRANRTLAQSAPTPGSVSYQYDSVGRIIQDTYPNNSAAYTYDAAGNRVALTLN
jgi:YD repeat-containing protein